MLQSLAVNILGFTKFAPAPNVTTLMGKCSMYIIGIVKGLKVYNTEGVDIPLYLIGNIETLDILHQINTYIVTQGVRGGDLR